LKCIGLKSGQKLHVQVLIIEHKVLHVHNEWLRLAVDALHRNTERLLSKNESCSFLFCFFAGIKHEIKVPFIRHSGKGTLEIGYTQFDVLFHKVYYLFALKITLFLHFFLFKKKIGKLFERPFSFISICCPPSLWFTACSTICLD